MVIWASHSERSAWHIAPPKASPAPRPFRTSTCIGGDSATPALVRASTPSGPRLTIARSRPISRRAWEASSGAFRTNCYSNLGLVADGNGGLPQRLPVTVARLLFRVPERRPEIEVEDRNARGAPLQRCQRRGAARFVGEPRARDPEQEYRRDRVKVEVFDRQVHIGGLRLAVEQDREVVWRVDLTERQGVLRSGSVPTQRLSTPRTPRARSGCTGRSRRRRRWS